MDWSKLSFNYSKTNTIISCQYKDGQWGEIESLEDDNIKIHAFSASLHYGLQCFEGIKAFNCKDGKVRIFRPDKNAERLIRSAEYLSIPYPSKELFIAMVTQAVKENIDFIPPHNVNGSLYIRPLLIGTGGQIGLKPSTEAHFMVMVAPVGSYSGNLLQPQKSVISREYDRAAPYGCGSYKVGGNYAASMLIGAQAKKAGFADVLFLDAKENKYIDEFTSSNFFGIKDNSYITPDSPSILPSITNNSLETLAKDLGMNVERRAVSIDELNTFEEVGQCGTAVVITPVSCIEDRDTINSPSKVVYEFHHKDENGELVCGPKSLKLYKTLVGIQKGEIEDKYGWNYLV